jgi:hypothetical protein
VVAFAAIAASATSAQSASAGALVDSVTCDAQPTSQVFLPWVDLAQYQLAPGGTAESSDGWTLTGNAGVAAGNEPYNVTGSGSSSLSLAPSSSATTAAMCAGVEHPTLRFFAKSSYASLLSSLRVEVVYEDASGATLSLPIGSVGATGSWGATPIYVVAANLLALLPGDQTAIAFRFTPVGGATWRVDDIHVDPYSRG